MFDIPTFGTDSQISDMLTIVINDAETHIPQMIWIEQILSKRWGLVIHTHMHNIMEICLYNEHCLDIFVRDLRYIINIYLHAGKFDQLKRLYILW